MKCCVSVKEYEKEKDCYMHFGRSTRCPLLPTVVHDLGDDEEADKGVGVRLKISLWASILQLVFQVHQTRVQLMRAIQSQAWVEDVTILDIMKPFKWSFNLQGARAGGVDRINEGVSG